jgi:hypothetical protein
VSGSYGTFCPLVDRERERRLAENDPVLRPLIEADHTEARQEAIGSVIAHMRPTIAAVLSRQRGSSLTAEDIEDAAATVTMRLIRRLQSVPFSDDSAIVNLDDFTARLTYNAIYEILRRRFPLRTRLKNRVRYVLSEDDRFALWVVHLASVAGLRHWRGRTDVVTHAALPASQSTPRMLDERRTGDALEAVLAHFGAPLTLNDLTDVVAALWGVTDASPDDVPEWRDRDTPSEKLETKERLVTLWREIQQLQPAHRMALLLNLRDAEGSNGLALFVLLDVASLGDIAAALEMTSEQLADLWHDLPIDDRTIATMLGKTRQQVINLRKAARERLARRLVK